MLKEHIHDLYTEGLGDIFYMKFYKFINKNIKSSVVKELFITIYTIIYLIFILGIVYVIFKLSFPL